MPTQIRFQRRSSLASPASFLARLALTAAGVLVASQVVPGIHCDSLPGLLATALVLGLLNAFLRPLLLVVSLPLVVLSLGLFLWIINAGLLSLAGWLVKPFHVDSFPSALGGAAVISLVSLLGSSLLGLNSTTRTARTPQPPRPPNAPPPGSGPIIDV